jgi:eukaryotic-like serine/threonine-protein kinase
VRNWRPEIPGSLARVAALALEKRPEARYADGRQMASDLLAALDDVPLDDREIGPDTVPGDGLPPNSSGFDATQKINRTD